MKIHGFLMWYLCRHYCLWIYKPIEKKLHWVSQDSKTIRYVYQIENEWEIRPYFHTLSDSHCDFHYFLRRTLWNYFQGKSRRCLQFQRLVITSERYFKTNVIKWYFSFEEIIACLTRREARLSSQVAVSVRQCIVKIPR